MTLLLTDANGRTLATVLTNADRTAGDYADAHTLPATLPDNVVWLRLQTEEGTDSASVSVQP